MSKTINTLIAGFGGQGVLFAGKVMAYAGLIDGKELSWLPSYGPEMRGGTCNCSIVISDEPIGSPLVTAPDVLIAMNKPSLDKFIGDVVPGGTVLIDSSIIDDKVERTDVNVYYVPATKMAEDKGYKGLANIVLVGKLLKEIGFTSENAADKAIDKCVPAKKAAMVEMNKNALKLGLEA